MDALAMDARDTDPPAPQSSNLYRYRFGEVEFDEARFELRVGGLAVELERKPLVVLLALLRRPGEVVSRDELLAIGWGNRLTVYHALSNCVRKLRAALGPADENRIATVPKAGYRFDGTLDRFVVGRTARTAVNLARGGGIHGRDDFRLERQIALTDSNEVWLARCIRNPVAQISVFKFSRDGESLARLKRETTVHRFLTESLGPRADFVALKSWNFEAAPFFIETDYCGSNLLAWSETDGQLRALGLSARLDLFLQIADAVAAAHSVGVFHKDLKPANIFVVPSAHGLQIKVGDFGNSSMLEPDRLEELHITRMGMTVSSHDATERLSGPSCISRRS